MPRRLLWFCQVALSLIIGLLVFVLISNLTGSWPTYRTFWMVMISAFGAVIALMVWLDKLLNKGLSLSKLAILSQKQKINWIGKHPTLISMFFIYILIAVVGAVVYRVVMNEAKAASDGLFLGFLWMLFCPSEVMLLVTGVIMAFLLDRHQLRAKLFLNNGDAVEKVDVNKILLVSIALPALLLYGLFFRFMFD